MRHRAPVAAAAIGLVAAMLSTTPAQASPSGDGVVINEAYLNGGSAGATYKNKFVELANPTGEEISLEGWSVQYRSSSSIGKFTGVIDLHGVIQPGGTYLVSGNSNADNGESLPTPDASSSVAFSGSTGGTLALSRANVALSGDASTVLADPNLVDLLGYGASTTAEGDSPAARDAYSVTSSLNRTDAADSDDNAADFTGGDPTPTACGADCEGSSQPPVTLPIDEIQGTTDTSPYAGRDVVTSGVVTADYDTGGFNGFYLQTGGTGGDVDLATHDSSDAVFVYGRDAAAAVDIGDSVQVSGQVQEYHGLTEISADTVEPAESAPPVKAATVAYPRTDQRREALEGMLVDPQGTFTVTDNYQTNRWAEIGLASGSKPLPQPTSVADPHDADAVSAVVADNAARSVTLDDGASIDFLPPGGGDNQDIPLPWLTGGDQVRVGARVSFTRDVVLDYRNDAWKLQPVQQLTADDVNGVEPATFEQDRPARPQDVGGNLRLASFNVLNYFTHLGADLTGCEPYVDRDDNPIAVQTGCDARGAWNTENLDRQQVKIVHAINRLDADVVSLEEIENSVKFGTGRDESLATLVDALNADAGNRVWDYVRSPAADNLPALADQDVIRTAFIYRTADIETVGTSSVLVGSSAFDNAREPLAQAFRPKGGEQSDTFVVVANHFKSKGSGVDDGTGQGNANPDRIAQAQALVPFAQDAAAAAGTDKIFLTGDFNAYTKEDPVKVLTDAGFVDMVSQYTDKETYLYDGMVGSLDHILASPAAAGSVSGADVWNINAYEPVATEYSRYNYNASLFWDAGPNRSSDHDPIVVGIQTENGGLADSEVKALATPGLYNLLGPSVIVQVKSKPRATGTVTVSEEGIDLETARLHHGAAFAVLDREALLPGRHTLDVAYSGDDAVAPSRTSVTVRVLRLPFRTGR